VNGRTLSVALVQLRTPAEQVAALGHAAPLIREAAAGGARLIATPEATNLLEQRRGLRDRKLRGEGDDPCVLGLRELAAEVGVWLLIGSAIVRSEAPGETRAANRSLLVDPEGRLVARYDKLHVFDVDLPDGDRYRESESVRPGEAAAVVGTPWGGLGLTVCYDVRFPHLYRGLAQAGADLIAVPAAFTRPTGEAHWETLLRARAIETGAFVLAPAQGGTHEDGRQTWGRSLVVGPWGEVLARLDHDEPGVLHAKLDLDAVAKARAAIPAWRDDRPFARPHTP
jgi:predicted amidohydrolase